MVQVLEHHILQLHGPGQAVAQPLLVKEVAHLNANLGIFVGIEGSNAALGGAKGLSAQALLLVAVLEHVVGHEQLGPLRNDQLGRRHTLIGDGLELLHQLHHIQGNAVANDVGDVGIKNAGGQNVKRKPTIVIDNGMSSVGTALEPDDHVRGLRQHVGDLALSFVAPVGTYDCFNHNYLRSAGFATM